MNCKSPDRRIQVSRTKARSYLGAWFGERSCFFPSSEENYSGSFYEQKVTRSSFSQPKAASFHVPGGVPDQAGWGPGQSALVLELAVGNPAHSRGGWN